MKRHVPARVISGMTRAAGIGTHITGDVRLDGTILRRYGFALEIAERNQCEKACGCNRCDNEQPLPPGSRQLRHNLQDRYYEKRGVPANPQGLSRRQFNFCCTPNRWAVVRRTKRCQQCNRIAQFYSRSRNAVIRVYDDTGNAIAQRLWNPLLHDRSFNPLPTGCRIASKTRQDRARIADSWRTLKIKLRRAHIVDSCTLYASKRFVIECRRMDISFNCPHCDQHLAVDESGTGARKRMTPARVLCHSTGARLDRKRIRP